MTSEDVYAIVKDSPYTFKEFSEHVCVYMDIPVTKKNTDRVYQLISPKGHGAPSEQEMSAMTYWVEVYKDPFGHSVTHYRAKDLPKNLLKLKHYLRTRIYNRKGAESLIKFFSSLI